MTPAEHYAAAESYLDDAHDHEADSPWRALLIAEAQVHATLAHAGAAAEGVIVSLKTTGVRADLGDARDIARRVRFGGSS